MLGGNDLALYWACRNGHLEVAMALIEKGAASNATTPTELAKIHPIKTEKTHGKSSICVFITRQCCRITQTITILASFITTLTI